MNAIFSSLAAVTAKTRCISLQEAVQAAAQRGKAILPIVGDCMEGRNILDGGWVAVDFTHYPRPGRRESGQHFPGDPCICYAQFPNKPNEPPNPPAVMVKEYSALWCGHVVGTRYKRTGGNVRVDCGFPAIAILGVVFASWGPDGTLLWETAPNTYPTELPSRSTVRRGDIEPVPDIHKHRLIPNRPALSESLAVKE